MSRLMHYTGNIVDVFNLKKEDIDLEIIIRGACRINRFLGQTSYAYPVAAHITAGIWYLNDIGASDELKKKWFLHEAFESYTGVDLPSPLKAELSIYKDAEKALKVIAEHFNLDGIECKEVKELDSSIMIAEAIELMPNKRYWIDFALEQNIPLFNNICVIEEKFVNEENMYRTLYDIAKKIGLV